MEFDTFENEYEVKKTVKVETECILWLLETVSQNQTKMIYYVNSDAQLDGLPNWVIRKAMKDGMHLPLKICQILEEGKPLEVPNNGN